MDEEAKTSEFPVERFGYKDALEKYGKDNNLIVLVSWMPPNEDWMKDITALDSVKEVILIGPVDGTCGGINTYDEWNGFERNELNTDPEFPRQYNKLTPDYNTESKTVTYTRVD